VSLDSVHLNSGRDAIHCQTHALLQKPPGGNKNHLKLFFYICLSPAKSSLKKTTKFSNFQRTVFFFTAHCNFIFSALLFYLLCAENLTTAR
ncbi:MAG: hypothetical protein J6C86_11000, partial [Bacteroidaceae bacterium]|nr:hypothetical protein [Bacteroidaceae bacterium]